MDDILSNEDYERLLSLGMQNAEMEPDIAQQIEQAKMLRERGGAMPQGQMAGRVFAAPNPLQYAAAVGHQFKADDLGKQVLAGQKQMAGNTRGQNEIAMRGILGTPGASVPQQPMDPYAQFRMGGGT